MSPVLIPVFVLAAVAATAVTLAQTPTSAAERPMQLKKSSVAAAALSQADREALLQTAERLKSTQSPGGAAKSAIVTKSAKAAKPGIAAKVAAAAPSGLDKEVYATEAKDRGQLEAATRGTSGILVHLAGQGELRLTPDQKDLLFQSLADSEAVQREAASRSVTAADVERARQTERQVVLTYWNNSAQGVKKADVLTPHQMGYVFEQRFKTLNEALSGPGVTAGVQPAELARVYQQGAERAAALSRQTDVARPPGLADLLESFDNLSIRALQGPVTPAVAMHLQAANDDLGQQGTLISLGYPAVKLTVRTIRQTGADKAEVQGYNVRYELDGDDFLDEPKGKSFSGTTTLIDQLGPYWFVFWAERMGQPVSAKKWVNLGDPPVASREIEIPLGPGTLP